MTTRSMHDFCREGETSWCGWKRDIAKGTQEYMHKSPLPPAVAGVVKPTFEALSADELLPGRSYSKPE